MAARVAQSVVQLLLATNPNARVAQSVVQLILIPSPAPPATIPFRPLGGGGMIEPQCCPPAPPRPRCVDEYPESEPMSAELIQSLFRHRR